MSSPQSMDPAQATRVFISHSVADNAFGVRLAGDLRRVLGDPSAVWYDNAGGLRPGAAWWQTIVKEIEARPIFLVIWSPDARDSKWVNDEVDLAWQDKNGPNGKIIIPLLWRNCDLRADLRTRQAIAFNNPTEYDERFAELLTGLHITPDRSAPEIRSAVIASNLSITGMQSDSARETITNVQCDQILIYSIDGQWPPTGVPVCESVVTVGRESGNDILVADPTVSRFHLRLERRRAGWRVEIVDNAKPMYVNGEPRTTAMLGHGDQIVIGGTMLRLDQSVSVAGATATVSNDTRTVLASGLTPYLEVETQQFRFTTPLLGDLTTVGRAQESAIVIPSPLVSAHQAVIRRMPDDSFLLETSGEARNPFMLGGRQLKRHTLRHGDTLTLGSHVQSQYVSLHFVFVG